MKGIYIIPLFFIFMSCNKNTALLEERSFSSDIDTLVFQMQKERGYGPFTVGATYLPVRDSNEVKELGWFEIPKSVPDDIDEIKFAPFAIWMEHPRSFYGDTSHVKISSNDDNTMIVLIGSKNDQQVCVIDANHNQNLADDEVRNLKPFKWAEDEDLIECNYQIPLDSGIKEDSSWVNIGLRRDEILINVAQHFTASFQLDGVQYKLGLNGNSNSLVVFEPRLALIQENGVKRDSLFTRDLVHLKGSIKIGAQYYRFQDFFSGSHTLVLIKDSTFNQRAGVQPGMIAPDFEFRSTSGDTIMSDEFLGKQILIANVSGCTPRSFKHYQEILDNVSDEVIVIGMNSGANSKMKGLTVDVEEEVNSKIYDLFRKSYSSYDCYLISKEGVLQDKFEIFDWETNMLELRRNN